MICKKCGAELNSESAFCPKCGKKVKTSKVGRILGGFITVAVLGIGMQAPEEPSELQMYERCIS